VILVDQQDRDLLIRIDERTEQIPELMKRVRALEDFRIRTVSYACGAGAVVAFFVDLVKEILK
jgi:hypothetical protein